jgi:hypothetical protein
LKLLLIGLCLVTALAIACGGDDDDSSGATQASGSDGGTAATQAPSGDGAAPTEAPSDSGGGSASGGGGGSLTLGDEVISLDRARCYMQEQDVAGSPGKILFTAQGFGTNADGEDLVLDISRYDEDSLFYGDDILVDVGDPFSDDAVSWHAASDFGTVEQDGSTLRADGLTFMNGSDGSQVSGAFELAC